MFVTQRYVSRKLFPNRGSGAECETNCVVFFYADNAAAEEDDEVVTVSLLEGSGAPTWLVYGTLRETLPKI